MAPVIVDSARIRPFAKPADWETWLAKHHDSETELFLQLYKKGSGVESITYAEALDVALCWGWIDGLKKSYDEASFLQRFSPRKAGSIWSQANRDHVARLTEAGRMQPSGQAHIDAAKANGRWDAAYASASKIDMPADLLAAIAAIPAAQATFDTLNSNNRYALAFRLGNLKTEAGRQKKLKSFVDMLARGEMIYPQKARP